MCAWLFVIYTTYTQYLKKPEEGIGFFELELHVAVSQNKQMPETEPNSSPRAATALNCWAFSSALKKLFLTS